MAPGASVMEGFPDQFGIAARTPLKSERWIKGVTTTTGTLARSSHGQFSSTFRAPVLTEQNVKIEFLDLFLKKDDPILNKRDPFN